MQVVITKTWQVPIMCAYRVITGIYVGMEAHGFGFVDTDGGVYYADHTDYEYAQAENVEHFHTFDRQMSDMRILVWHHDTGPPAVGAQAGHWRDGYTPELLRRECDRVWFELTYETWIVQGYVVIDK